MDKLKQEVKKNIQGINFLTVALQLMFYFLMMSYSSFELPRGRTIERKPATRWCGAILLFMVGLLLGLVSLAVDWQKCNMLLVSNLLFTFFYPLVLLWGINVQLFAVSGYLQDLVSMCFYDLLGTIIGPQL